MTSPDAHPTDRARASKSRELAFLDRHLSRYKTPDSTPLPDSFLSPQSTGTTDFNPRSRITLPRFMVAIRYLELLGSELLYTKNYLFSIG